jgi:hypothetical protein
VQKEWRPCGMLFGNGFFPVVFAVAGIFVKSKWVFRNVCAAFFIPSFWIMRHLMLLFLFFLFQNTSIFCPNLIGKVAFIARVFSAFSEKNDVLK